MKKAFILAMVLLSGCSAVKSRDNSHMSGNQTGHLYAGTRLNMAYWKCFVLATPPSLIFTAVAVPYMLVDGVASIAMDTALMPMESFHPATKARAVYDKPFCDSFWL